MVFSENYGYFYKNYLNGTKITIEGFKNDSFSFQLQQSSIIDEFTITFSFNFSVQTHPKATVYLTTPSLISVQLTTNQVSTDLNDFYFLDDEKKSQVETIKQTSDSLNQITSKAFIINNVILSSTMGISCLISMENLRFLRYFTIDYPPHVIAMYQASIPFSDLLPNWEFEEDANDCQLPDSFAKYEFSIYPFNNCGNILIETVVYISFGFIVLSLLKLFKTKQKLLVILIILRMIFVWNYPLGYFLSQFMSINLATYLAYRYPPLNKGGSVAYFNYFFSIFTGAFISLTIVFCFLLIKKLRPSILRSQIKASMVFPVSERKEIFDESGIELSSKRDKSIVVGNDNRNFILGSSNPEIFRKNESEFIRKNNILDVSQEENTISKIVGKSNDIIVEKTEKKSNFYEEKRIELKNANENVLNNSKYSSFSPKIYEKNSIILDKSEFISRNLPSFREKTKVQTGFSQIKMKISNILSSLNKPFDWRTVDYENSDKRFAILSKRFSPIHRDFNHRTKAQSYYLVFDILRQCFFCLFVVELFDQPFEGLFLISCMNFFFILCYLFISPLKQKSDFIQILVNELCLIISSLCALIMAFMEKMAFSDLDLKLKLGWVMVGANFLLISIFLIRVAVICILLIFILSKMAFKGIMKKFRGTEKIYMENEETKNEKKDNEHVIIQEIIGIQNFLS